MGVDGAGSEESGEREAEKEGTEGDGAGRGG